MCDIFRIHGDNIVECERIANLIVSEIAPSSQKISLSSPSTLVFDLAFEYCDNHYEWKLELLPGFNKSGRKRWKSNIFNALKENGSFLDETPDAIVTHVEGTDETIIYAIEFCSALQAGNQAWQRSGRAFSTGRTGCPYLYIVDFVKYELDSKTRERKALRFPNPAVPYSYINYSKDIDNFVAQVYVRSEEFDKSKDSALTSFDENNFADKELSAYIVKRMAGIDTSAEEALILEKNLNVVMFLAQSSKPTSNFTPAQWKRLYAYEQGILEFSKENTEFNFHKTITAKGHHGNSAKFLDLIDQHSIGLASRDLPFGIIPATSRPAFAKGLQRLYPNYDPAIINSIGSNKKDLILCLIKGFKPRGDDNRPDRGILPLAAMLASTESEIMTYIYGPVLANNLDSLLNTPKRLASSNGLWKSILSISNYVALDVPVLKGTLKDDTELLDTARLKAYYTAINATATGLTKPLFSSRPQEYHEDDVDTGIHFLFSHVLNDCCFEGLCNPPGGDWSGLSIIDGAKEVRWLSLPRVSDEIDGKRPDHVLQLFDVFEKPLLLSVESKERAIDLEPGVGDGLKNYIKFLMGFIPNVERALSHVGNWSRATTFTSYSDYEVISAAAYLKSEAQPNTVVFKNSNCDMLFIMTPLNSGWEIELVPNTKQAAILKDFIINKVKSSKQTEIVIK